MNMNSRPVNRWTAPPTVWPAASSPRRATRPSDTSPARTGCASRGHCSSALSLSALFMSYVLPAPGSPPVPPVLQLCLLPVPLACAAWSLSLALAAQTADRRVEQSACCAPLYDFVCARSLRSTKRIPILPPGSRARSTRACGSPRTSRCTSSTSGRRAPPVAIAIVPRCGDEVLTSSATGSAIAASSSERGSRRVLVNMSPVCSQLLTAYFSQLCTALANACARPPATPAPRACRHPTTKPHPGAASKRVAAPRAAPSAGEPAHGDDAARLPAGDDERTRRLQLGCGRIFIQKKRDQLSWWLWYEMGERSCNAKVRPNPIARVISDCHFRKTATVFDRTPGIKWLSGTAK
jgi:hypothetical protein